MTISKLKALLESTNYPVSYNHFKTPPPLPYIIFMVSKDESGSDEKNLIEDMDVCVELYTNKKDLTAEQKVRDVLNFVEFENDEVYIDKEGMFMNIYEFTVTQKVQKI